MKKLFLFLFIVLFVGCSQPKIVKNERVPIKLEKSKYLSYRDYNKAASYAVEKLKKEKLAVKDGAYYIYKGNSVRVSLPRYKTSYLFVSYYNVEDGKAEAKKIITKYQKYVNEYLDKLVKNREVIANLKKRAKEELLKNPSKYLVVGNSVLTPMQKKIFLRKILKYVNVNAKIQNGKGVVCYSLYGRSLKFGSLEFKFDTIRCNWFNYYPLNSRSLRREIFLNIYFLPKFRTNLDNLNISLSSNIGYNSSYTRKIVKFSLSFSNKTNKFKTIQYLSVYHIKNVLSYKNSILISPYSEMKKNIDSDESYYDSEVTKENKNNLTYGIAIKTDKDYSFIRTTTFDELFDKYVK